MLDSATVHARMPSASELICRPDPATTSNRGQLELALQARRCLRHSLAVSFIPEAMNHSPRADLQTGKEN
jgi:hypothetical protein